MIYFFQYTTWIIRSHHFIFQVFEEQNAVLNKQIDHMKSVMDRVKSEIVEQENENNNMQSYLDKIRQVLKFLIVTQS